MNNLRKRLDNAKNPERAEIDVFFYEAFKEEKDLLKKYLPKNITAGFFDETIQESKVKNPPAKIISIRTQSRIPKDWINKISAIITRSTGFDHLEEHSRKILCGYLPEYCIRSVAEQTMLLWMCLLRKLPKQIKQFSDFNRDNLTGSEAEGKKILIVGIGKIGYEIYNIAKGLEMKTFGVDIIKRYSDVNYMPIEEAIKTADIIVCSMNLTKENSNYFNYDLLKKTKPGAMFINITRGEISPAKDLLKLINENHLGGLALDVYDKESLIGESLRNEKIPKDEEVKAVIELGKKENVILTPHNSFNTFEALERKAIQTIQQLNQFLNEKDFLWKVPID